MKSSMKDVVSVACIVAFVGGVGVFADRAMAHGQTNCSRTCDVPGGTVTAYSTKNCSSNEGCLGTCTLDPGGTGLTVAKAWCVPL